MAPTPAADRLLLPAEVAHLCGVSTVSVRRWIAEGQLEALRLGDRPNPHLRISGDALDRFLHSTRNDKTTGC